jgi:hypothetical protein
MILTGAAIWIAGVSKTYTPAIKVAGVAAYFVEMIDTPAMILTGAAMRIAGVSKPLSMYRKMCVTYRRPV